MYMTARNEASSLIESALYAARPLLVNVLSMTQARRRCHCMKNAHHSAAAAVGGAGFIRVFDFAVHAQIASGLLQPVLRDWNEESTHPVSIVHAGSLPLLPQLEIFAQFVTGLFPVHASVDRLQA